MRILAIETSCDETGAAVVEKEENKSEVFVLSNSLATSLALHKKTGGIIPENAAREQIKYILPVITEALLLSVGQKPSDSPKEDQELCREILRNSINAIAVTYGPGLIGSLLVGVETAKTLAYVFNKPLIPVNHLLAHLYANIIDSDAYQPIIFPFIGLIVSGGHTDLLLFTSHDTFQWLGGTRDDAAGEAFDKIGRLLGLSYPAGPEIDKRAKKVVKTDLMFKSPLLHSDDLDFSFSGLKTEVMRFVQKQEKLNEERINEICFATQKAIVDVLITKTIKATLEYNAKTIVVGGGVSANSYLREVMVKKVKEKIGDTPVSFPLPKYSTDNGAAIGAYALFHTESLDIFQVTAQPELYLT